MNSLRRILGALLFATALSAPPALATSFSIDQSDLYYIATEQGWGIQLVQRGSVIFATLFVYGPTGTPTWYVSTMNSTDGATWDGDLYATTGPYFATLPFNPANVAATKVGTMHWQPQTIAAGTLTYDVNGVIIVKNVTRQSLVLDDYSGTYLGAFHASAINCSNPTDNAPPADIPFATITVAQTGQSVTLTISAFGVMLTVTGTASQDGQFGSLAGTYSGAGEIGNATLSQMNVQTNSLSAVFSLQSTNIGCLTAGYLVGMRSGS
jgi:hypothetical protein